MKPTLLKVQQSPVESFHIRHEKVPYFNNPWHYHPEIELTFVLESSGIRYVGDSILPFGSNDLVLLGPNLPHFWQNDDRFHRGSNREEAEAIILRFKSDIWGIPFWDAPESQEIKKLFLRASKGILFDQSVAERIKPLLIKLCQAENSRRMWLWIQIFEILAQTTAYQFLSQSTFITPSSSKDATRIHAILHYIQDHLSENMGLHTVAGIAHMTPAAFCRYFKQQTDKTFIEALHEIRINYACRLLVGTAKDIGQIGFESGFRNVPHFNQVFKTQTGLCPSNYRLKNREACQ